MTDHTIEILRNQLRNTDNWGSTHILCTSIIDRLEVAETRIAHLESSQQPRPMADAPRDGSEVLAWARHVGWSVLSWSNVRDGWVGNTQEWPTHWVYLPKAVDDTYTRGAIPLPDQSEVKS